MINPLSIISSLRSLSEEAKGLAGGLSPLDYDAALSFPYGAAVLDHTLWTASYGSGAGRQKSWVSIQDGAQWRSDVNVGL